MLKYSNYFNTVAAVSLSTGWPYHIQGDSGAKVNNVGGDSIGHCKGKKVSMNTCPILIGY